MRADKKKKRAKDKKKQQNRQKAQKRFNDSYKRLICEEDNEFTVIKEPVPEVNRNPFDFSENVLRAIELYACQDSFPPHIIGKMLGGYHHSKVNKMLESAGLQLKKEKHKRRELTEKGKDYVGRESTSFSTWPGGWQWKRKAIELIAQENDIELHY